MDGSKRSSHGNAYFAGFGPAKRIVFFDTLLARLTPSEIEAVLAHELGHHKLLHIWKRALLLFAASFGLLWGLGQLIDQRWFYEGLGVSTPSPAAGLILFMMVVPVFLFFLQPLSSRFSRRHEFEADAYSSAHAKAMDLESALVKLYKDNAATLTPDPLHSAFYDSHPPAIARISRLANCVTEEIVTPNFSIRGIEQLQRPLCQGPLVRRLALPLTRRVTVCALQPCLRHLVIGRNRRG